VSVTKNILRGTYHLVRTELEKSEILRRTSERIKTVALGDTGYVVPGSRRKAMKGVRTRPNSPDVDIVAKLDAMRGLSRDMAMNSPLAVSILERHKIHSIGSGLQYQSKVDKNFLNLSLEQAVDYQRNFEREFDLWAESFNSDYDGINYYGDNQALGYYNMLLSGDFFIIPVWRQPDEKDFPYEFCIKLVAADLVRDPRNFSTKKDIAGGVEFDSSGRLLGYHVWNSYENDFSLKGVKADSQFIPAFDSNGRRQIYHVFDPKLIKQRRGVNLLAPVAEPLKQITRLSESELMSSLVAAFFTAFVRDSSGLGTLLPEAITPDEAVGGGGQYGPNDSNVYPKDLEASNDLQMGYGNIVYLDEHKDVTIADAKKTDRDFGLFWDSLATQVCAAANIPVEQAQLKYTTSYTAARAAANDVWKYRLTARELINRRMNKPILDEFFHEAILKGRINAPQFFDDYAYRKAWTKSSWVGMGQGYLDPLRESKANAIALNNKLDTYEDIYTSARGGRWDSAMERRASEEQHLEQLGLQVNPDPSELIGPDGQQDN
jgi:lambda family phage portal protein